MLQASCVETMITDANPLVMIAILRKEKCLGNVNMVAMAEINAPD